MTKWEYKTLEIKPMTEMGEIEAQLRLLGEQGWELTAAGTAGYSNWDNNGRTWHVLYLMRPMQTGAFTQGPELPTTRAEDIQRASPQRTYL